VVVAFALAAVLKGTVELGPLRPVCRAGMRCEQPASGVRLTFTRGSHVYTTRTDAGGAYVISLAPGTYSVTASRGMRIAPDVVTVHAGTQRRAFAIDTGIR
jgi:hypothetical protein